MLCVFDNFFVDRNSLWPPTDPSHKAGPGPGGASLTNALYYYLGINKRKNDGGNFRQDKEWGGNFRQDKE